MSTKETTAVDIDEARRVAMHAVRFNLGTFLRLDDGKFDEEELEYIFPIILHSPKLILDGSKEEAIDLRFLEAIQAGNVVVDASTKEVNHPTANQIKKKLENYEKELNEAVQKALVRASGGSLSHLPFPENQYAPIQDILSEVILNGEIYLEDIEMMDSYEGKDKYQKHIDNLVEIDLLKRGNLVLRSGDVLNTIQQKDKFGGHEVESHQDELNAALGLYFEHNIGEFDMIKQTLGPYLALSGFYYQRALTVGDLPTIKEKELRTGIKMEYAGREQKKKLFKMSRYLIQLEDVGVLNSVYRNGERYWVGDDNTFSRLVTAADEMGPVSKLFSPSLSGQQRFGSFSD